MILKLEQTSKDLYAASFILKRGGQVAGEAAVNGKMGHREAKITGTFCQTRFELCYGKNKYVVSKPFRPYRIFIGKDETGVVYQAEQKTGLFKSRSFHQMAMDGHTYDCYAVAMKEERTKHPVYCGEKQVALVETDRVIYDELHHYYIYAPDESSSLTGLLFSLYMYVHAGYEPGVKVTKSVSTSSYVTKDPFLLDKYHPDFKKWIEE